MNIGEDKSVEKPWRGKVSGFQGFRVSRFQGFRVPRFQSFKVSRFQGFRVSKFQGFRVSMRQVGDRLVCPRTFSRFRSGLKNRLTSRPRVYDRGSRNDKTSIPMLREFPATVGDGGWECRGPSVAQRARSFRMTI